MKISKIVKFLASLMFFILGNQWTTFAQVPAKDVMNYWSKNVYQRLFEKTDGTLSEPFTPKEGAYLTSAIAEFERYFNERPKFQGDEDILNAASELADRAKELFATQNRLVTAIQQYSRIRDPQLIKQVQQLKGFTESNLDRLSVIINEFNKKVKSLGRRNSKKEAWQLLYDFGEQVRNAYGKINSDLELHEEIDA